MHDMPPKQDVSRSVRIFEALAHWLNQPAGEEAAPEVLLAELQQLLEVSAVGVWGPLEGIPTVCFQVPPRPTIAWRQSNKTLEELRQNHSAILTEEGANRHWLLTPLMTPGCGVSWIFGAARKLDKSWEAEDRGLMFMAGQTLFRRLTTSSKHPAWMLGIEKAQLDRDMNQAIAICSRVAHDFGNVLTGVLGFSELILSQISTDDQHYGFLKEVWTSARKGAQWVQMLQTFSRKFPPPTSQPSDAALILHEEIGNLKKTGVKSAAFDVQIPNRLPRVLVDAGALKQLFVQLLSNAVDALRGDNGRVTVRGQTVELTQHDCLDLIGSAKAGAYVEIQIQDDGVGIAPEHREKLFRELFFSTKTRHRGLGLAVAYGILRASQAGLRFQRAVPSGTLVSLYLPSVGHVPAVQATLEEITSKMTAKANLPR